MRDHSVTNEQLMNLAEARIAALYRQIDVSIDQHNRDNLYGQVKAEVATIKHLSATQGKVSVEIMVSLEPANDYKLDATNPFDRWMGDTGRRLLSPREYEYYIETLIADYQVEMDGADTPYLVHWISARYMAAFLWSIVQLKLLRTWSRFTRS